jgi:hypothetical protein
MPELFILNTPEFEPIVETARRAGMRIHDDGDYLTATSAEPQVTLLRRHTNVRPSIWFAALTGGLTGEIITFDHDMLCIREDA